MLNRLESVRQHVQLELPKLLGETDYLKVIRRLDKIEDDILDQEEF